MDRQEIYFTGALFFAICALSSGQWPDYAAFICVGCALVAAISFWRGFTLHILAHSNSETKRQQVYQSALTEQYQQIQSRYDALQQAMSSWENALREQSQSLLSCINAVQKAVEDGTQNLSNMLDAAAAQSKAEIDRTHELSGQYIGELKESMAEQGKQRMTCFDRLSADNRKLCELLNQQRAENASHWEGLLAVILDMEKELKLYPQETQAASDAITNALSEVESGLRSGANQLRGCIREGNDLVESQFTTLQEILEQQFHVLEKEIESQRNLMDRAMQKYSDITEQDLEALRLIMER